MLRSNASVLLNDNFSNVVLLALSRSFRSHIGSNLEAFAILDSSIALRWLSHVRCLSMSGFDGPRRCSATPTGKDVVIPDGDRVEKSTPKRRCYAPMSARSARVAQEPLQILAVKNHDFSQPANSVLSTLDDEFDKQFHLPDDSDGDDIKWRCPINFFLFQQRCMQFIDFRQRGSSSSASALPISIDPPNAVLPSDYVSTSISSTLTPLLDHSLSMPTPALANAHAWSRMRPKATWQLCRRSQLLSFKLRASPCVVRTSRCVGSQRRYLSV